jgi:hypothetical protein
MLFAIGFVSVSPVFGDAKTLGDNFAVSLTATDVVEGGGTEVQTPATPVEVLISIEFGKEVAIGGATAADGTLEAADLTFTFYDEDGLLVAAPDTAPVVELRQADGTTDVVEGTAAKKIRPCNH